MFEPSPIASPAAKHVPEWIAALAARGEFVADSRYDPAAQPMIEPAAEGEDIAISDAFERGREQGAAEATARAGEEGAERRKLGSALRRMDEDMTQELGRQLSETIVALCEATLAPAALDRDLLAQRCLAAAQLIGGEAGERVLRLHPGDIAALDQDFRGSWSITPDPDLARGDLRIETPGGGISDGPGQWRAALRETLGLDPL